MLGYFLILSRGKKGQLDIYINEESFVTDNQQVDTFWRYI